jgi:acyl carrier protein
METTLRTEAEIIASINEFLADEFEVDIDTITPQASLNETLSLDSLDYIDLVVMTESNFGFKVKAEDLQGIKVFQDFYDYIISKVGARNE